MPAKASNILPLASSGGQVANAIRPPGFVTRSISFIATSGLGAKICPKLDITISNELSSNGRSSTSHSFHSISFASANSSVVKSTPVTLAAPPSLLAVIAVLPVPHATSNTLSSKETLHNLTR